MKFINKYNFKKYPYRLIFYIALSLIISYIILNASQSKATWYEFWNYFILNVPKQWPAFYDIYHIQSSLICKLSGIDPFITNPCEFNNIRYQYPITWLFVFEYLNLDIENNFRIFLFFILSFLFLTYFLLLEISNNKFNMTILILLFFSTSSMLVIERGNVDLLIFSLTSLIVLFPSYYVSLFIISGLSLLKIYPFFLFFHLLAKHDKKIITISIMLLVIYFIYEVSIAKYIDKNHSIMALSQSYGVQSITEGIFKTLEKTNFAFITENQKNIIRLISSLVFLLICILFFFIGINSKKKIEFLKKNIQKNLFILGATIYIGSFIFYSNIDYRLIFLFFTIPFMENFNKKINYSYCFSILIISNSFFLSFTPLTIEHIIYTSMLYSIKLFLVFFLAYYLGILNKDFFKLKT
jgi:hypothetical protein